MNEWIVQILKSMAADVERKNLEIPSKQECAAFIKASLAILTNTYLDTKRQEQAIIDIVRFSVYLYKEVHDE